VKHNIWSAVAVEYLQELLSISEAVASLCTNVFSNRVAQY
jgi:hypothetical protein